ncbi:MAG: hypothetical protein GDA55_01995 [Cellvibrionales bacterium]|nr:hypothetical protein [Cellvibrionales bacterium]
MCIIIDANVQGDFMNQKNKNMQPVHLWLEKGGKIAYSNATQFNAEIRKRTGFKDRLDELAKTGRAKLVDKRKVQAEQATLPKLQSNDPHIIALALAAKAKVLVSKDQALHADFKEIAKGSVYQTAQHKHLLTADLCP